MKNLIREKGKILIICTNRRLTKNGGIVKYYKMYVFNTDIEVITD